MAESEPNNITFSESNAESLLETLIDIAEDSSISIDENDPIIELNTRCFIELFGLLGKRDLNTIGRTCRRLRQIIESSGGNEATSSTVCLRTKCLQRIFTWLPLEILYSLSQKCDKLRIFAGEYFKRNFPAAIITGEPDGIYVHGTCFNHFSKFVENISILNADLSTFEYFRSDNFNSLKEINLSQIKLTTAVIGNTKDILANVETLELIDCRVAGEFGKLLKICTKLKRLSLRNRASNIVAGTSNQWLCKSHSGLQHLKLVGAKIDEIKTFFIRNRNIRSFATSANCLYENRNLMMEAKLRLDLLQVDIDLWAKQNMGLFCKLLNDIHGKFLYKRLHLNTRFVDQKSIKRMATLNSLERLIVVNCEKRDIILDSLVNLKELAISVSCHVGNLINMAKNLTKLERIFFYQAVADDILILIKHSATLREITVSRLPYGIHFVRGALDIVALNAEREKLPGAVPVKIYVDETIYLRTKWKTSQAICRLVEVKRLDEWPDPF